MNINEILSYKRPTESYYDILGCDQSSSVSIESKELTTTNKPRLKNCHITELFNYWISN